MILAIDIGTSFLKVAVIDFEGRLKFFDKGAVDVKYNGDSCEVSPLSWQKGLIELCGYIPFKYLHDIEAIVVSGNGPTIVPVDNLGEPLGDVLLWMDSSSTLLSEEVNRKLGESIPPNFYLSKAYWYKKEKPICYKNTSTFFSCPEYISYLLTGEVFTLLPANGFVDFYWTEDKITKLGLHKDKFPEFISPFQEYGQYNGFFGIPAIKKGTPVICSGPDYIMSILGAGTIEPGIVCDRTGTSEGINLCSDSNNDVTGLRKLPHIIPNLYTFSGLIPNSGTYLKDRDFDKLIFEYKSVINHLLDSGFSIKEIRVIGGHAHIKTLNEKKAVAFPFPLKIYSDGADLVGNAVLGSVVIKHYSSISEACKNMIREESCFNV